MELKVGEILEGKVSGITKFGAFVQLPGGGSGLVHISEVANTYVTDVHDHLAIGDTVKVKVLAVNEGKVNLSIKQALPPAPKPAFTPRSTQPAKSAAPASARYDTVTGGELHGPSGDASFEDKLKHFMQESDSRVSGNKLYAERKSSGRRRK